MITRQISFARRIAVLQAPKVPFRNNFKRATRYLNKEAGVRNISKVPKGREFLIKSGYKLMRKPA